MTEKVCSKCQMTKILIKDFYLCTGRYRSECKSCCIKRNVKYQREVREWRHTDLDDEERKIYMRNYYSENKEKFAAYRDKFRKRHPDYYKEYFMKRKEKKNGKI